MISLVAYNRGYSPAAENKGMAIACIVLAVSAAALLVLAYAACCNGLSQYYKIIPGAMGLEALLELAVLGCRKGRRCTAGSPFMKITTQQSAKSAPPAPIAENIPDDVWIEIFSKLEPESFILLPYVCRRFRELAAKPALAKLYNLALASRLAHEYITQGNLVSYHRHHYPIRYNCHEIWQSDCAYVTQTIPLHCQALHRLGFMQLAQQKADQLQNPQKAEAYCHILIAKFEKNTHDNLDLQKVVNYCKEVKGPLEILQILDSLLRILLNHKKIDDAFYIVEHLLKEIKIREPVYGRSCRLLEEKDLLLMTEHLDLLEEQDLARTSQLYKNIGPIFKEFSIEILRTIRCEKPIEKDKNLHIFFATLTGTEIEAERSPQGVLNAVERVNKLSKCGGIARFVMHQCFELLRDARQLGMLEEGEKLYHAMMNAQLRWTAKVELLEAAYYLQKNDDILALMKKTYSETSGRSNGDITFNPIISWQLRHGYKYVPEGEQRHPDEEVQCVPIYNDENLCVVLDFHMQNGHYNKAEKLLAFHTDKVGSSKDMAKRIIAIALHVEPVKARELLRLIPAGCPHDPANRICGHLSLVLGKSVMH